MNQTESQASVRPGPPERWISLRELFGILVLFGVLVALSWPGMNSLKVLDDWTQWRHVRDFSGWADCFGPDSFGLLRPAKNLFYYGVFQADLDIPPVWHGATLLLYFAAAAAIYLLLRQVLESKAWSFAAMAIWALSPTQVSTVIWPSCANISLAVVFLCGYLHFHRKAVLRGRFDFRGIVPMSLCLVGGLFTYEAVVSAVGLAFLCDQLRRNAWSRSRVEIQCYVMAFLLTLAFLALRPLTNAVQEAGQFNMGFPPDTEKWQLFVSGPWILCRHLLMWLWPADNIEFASSFIWGESVTPLGAALCWLLVTVLGVAVLAFWKRAPWVAFGVAWFYAASFPTSNFVPVYCGPVEDYYIVLPGIGLAIAVAGLIRLAAAGLKRTSWSAVGRRAAWAALVLLVGWRVSWLPLFHHQAGLWDDPEQLYRSVMNSRPCQYQGALLTANECFGKGRYEEALALCDKVLEDAPWHTDVLPIIGQCLARTGDHDGAKEIFFAELARESSRLPYKRMLWRELAQIHLELEEYESAVGCLEPLVADPRHRHHMPAVFMLAEAWRELGNEQAAREVIEHGMAIYPSHPVMVLRGKAFLGAGKEADPPSGS